MRNDNKKDTKDLNKEIKDFILSQPNFVDIFINVLNQNLSDNKNKFICIVAGYQDELDEMFFSFNPGIIFILRTCSFSIQALIRSLNSAPYSAMNPVEFSEYFDLKKVEDCV